MTAIQSAVLTTVISALLSPILVAIVAIIGLNRAKKTVLVLAIIGLVFFLSAEFGLRLAESGLTETTSPGTVHLISVFLQFGTLAVVIGSQAGSVGGFLALIRTAQTRHWGWFAGILVALIVSAIGGILQNTFVISQFTSTQRAIELLQAPGYVIVTTAIFSVTFIVQILYGIFGSDTPANATSSGAMQPTTA